MRRVFVLLFLCLFSVSSYAAQGFTPTVQDVDEIIQNGSMWDAWETITDVIAFPYYNRTYVAVATGRTGVFLFQKSSMSSTYIYSGKLDGLGDVKAIGFYHDETNDRAIIAVASGSDGVYLTDWGELPTSTVADPQIVGHYETNGDALDVSKQNFEFNQDLLVADSQDGLVLLQVHDTTMEMTLDGSFAPGGTVKQVDWISQYAVISTGEGGLYTVDTSDPADLLAADQFAYPTDKFVVNSTRIETMNQTGLRSMYINTMNGDLTEADALDMGSTILSITESPDFNYLYVGTKAGLKVVDEHDTGALEVSSTIAGVPTVLGAASANDYYFLITAGGKYFMDVSTDPANPTCTLKNDAVGEVLSISHQGSLAVTANGWNGARLLDISNLENPVETAHMLVPDCIDAVLLNNYVYSFSKNDSLYIYDVSNPTSPVLVTQMDLRGDGSLLDHFTDHPLDMNDQRLVIYGQMQHSVYDMSDPENPTFLYHIPVPDGGSFFSWVTLDGTSLYSSSSLSNNQTDFRYYKWDVSGTNEAVMLGSWDTTGEYYPLGARIAVEGDLLVSVEEEPYYYPESIIRVFSLANFPTVTELGSVTVEQWLSDYAVLRSNLLVAGDDQSGICVVNVGDPANPTVVMQDTTRLAHDADFRGFTLMTADLSQLAFWDVSQDMSVESDGAVLPSKYAIADLYPNPFNAMSTAVISLPEAGKLTVSVYNMLGQRVSMIAQGKFAAGQHRFIFDGHNLSSGMYLVRATVPGKMDQTKSVILLK